MPDSKITALTSISTSTDPANDPLVIVDVSDTSMAASGTTKKVTLNNLLACSPTATLASATITGDLTVDTSTLKVDSANNRVGVNNASPSTNLHVGSGVGLNNLGVGLSRGATTNFYEAFDGTKSFLAGTDSSQTGVKVGALSNHSMFLVCNNITQLQIDPLGVFSFTDGAGGTRMTLNSTGLGVGTGPSYKLHVFSASPILGIQDSSSAAGGVGGTINFLAYTSGTSGANVEAQIKGVKSSASSAGELQFFTSDSSGNSQQRLLIDGSGNPIFTPSSTPATLTTNGQLTVNATSNTNLRFSYRGSDGVTRVANITLA